MNRATEPYRHWTTFWDSGRLTSLPEQFPALYDGEVAEFWRQQLALTPEPGRVLDICTGSGAVALLLAGQAEQLARSVHISAVDAAHIEPERLCVQHPELAPLVRRIEFISDCPFEQLNRPAASFDHLVSQYGIEYCNWTQASQQCTHLLAPGGRLTLVCHSPDSRIFATMQAERENYQRLNRLGVVAAIRAELKGQVSWQKFRKALRQAKPAIEAVHRRRESGLYRYVLDMIRQLLKMNEATLRSQRPHLEKAFFLIQDWNARSCEMLRVNDAMLADLAWYRVFEQAGLMLEQSGEILYQSEHPVGRYYCFIKPEN